MHLTVKRTNHTLFDVDNTLAILLLEGLPDIFAKYERPAPPAEKAGWSVGTFISSGRKNITVRDGSYTHWFVGPPEKIQEFENTLPAAIGKCPENVLAQYAALYVPYVTQEGTS
jgi:hypothetical protein